MASRENLGVSDEMAVGVSDSTPILLISSRTRNFKLEIVLEVGRGGEYL